jgi:hypothetical protein
MGGEGNGGGDGDGTCAKGEISWAGVAEVRVPVLGVVIGQGDGSDRVADIAAGDGQGAGADGGGIAEIEGAGIDRGGTAVGIRAAQGKGAGACFREAGRAGDLCADLGEGIGAESVDGDDRRAVEGEDVQGVDVVIDHPESGGRCIGIAEGDAADRARGIEGGDEGPVRDIDGAKVRGIASAVGDGAAGPVGAIAPEAGAGCAGPSAVLGVGGGEGACGGAGKQGGADTAPGRGVFHGFGDSWVSPGRGTAGVLRSYKNRYP